MDIAALSVLKNQTQLQQDVGTSLMRKVMDTAEQDSNFVNKMMETTSGNGAKHASPPHLGNRLDVRV